MLQASTLLSAIPMIRGLLNGTEREDSRPWLIWFCAYTCHAVAITLNLKDVSELAYPVANAIMNATVLVIILSVRERKA
jgi:hypothetical protein